MKFTWLDQLRDNTPPNVREATLSKIEKALDRLVTFQDMDKKTLLEVQQQDTFSISRIQNLE